MDGVQVVVLSLLQGLTEFLPISSSAHLVLVPVLLGWQDQGIGFDVAVHVGTLAAVVAYFRRDLTTMSVDWLRSLAARRTVGDSRLAWLVILGTVPAGLGGIALKLIGDEVLRTTAVIAAATAGFALLLGWADRRARCTRGERELGVRDVLIVGCAQALALIPGTSRSGITITAGLALGLTREAAARFSFLLSIPIIALAGMVKALEAVGAGAGTDWFALGAGTVISAVAAYLTIGWFLRFVNRVGMMPFVLYRLALAVVLVAFAV